jgi:Zn-dependent protease
LTSADSGSTLAITLNALQSFLFVAPVLMFSVIAHEIAHGYAALKQGDPTAQKAGRLTWNPLKHISPFLTILLPVLMYQTMGVALGGAKPVPVDPRNYRNYRRGDIIVSLAGVVTNVALAFLCAGLVVLLGVLVRIVPVTEVGVGVLQAMLMLGIWLNLILASFNLLPIPPLDGSHVLKYVLPWSWSFYYQRLGFLGIILLIVIVKFTPGVLDAWFAPATALTNRIASVIGRQLTPSYREWMR